MKRPNVLIIYTDQQRWDAFGKVNPLVKTPNMDRLAEEGAYFESAFCNNPVCMASRMSMLSGQYPSSLSIGCNGIELPEDEQTVAGALNAAGYHTANLGKLHFLNHSVRNHMLPHPSYGFDHLEIADEPGSYECPYIDWVRNQAPDQVQNCCVGAPPAYKGTPLSTKKRHVIHPYAFEGPEHLTHSAFVAERTIAYMKSRQGKDQPFFAIAGFYAPHPPFNPPQRFVDMYNPADLPEPAAMNRSRKFDLPADEWKRIKAYYYAHTSHMDDQMGRILKYLDESGLADDTIVIFTSDHGENLGDRGNIQKGPPGYDSCTHVPLIVRYPVSVKAGGRFDAIVEAVDIVPSILDWCGVELPMQMQGRSFRPLLEDGQYANRSSALIEFKVPFSGSWRTVRTHGYWYSADQEGNEILCDLASDPDQLKDVSCDPSYGNALGMMRKELIDRVFDAEKQYPVQTAQY